MATRSHLPEIMWGRTVAIPANTQVFWHPAFEIVCGDWKKIWKYKNVSESQQSKISWKTKLLMNPRHFCSNFQHCISPQHYTHCHAMQHQQMLPEWPQSGLHLQYAINAALLPLTPVCCYLTLKNNEDALGPTVSIFSQDSFTWKQKYIYLSMQISVLLL